MDVSARGIAESATSAQPAPDITTPVRAIRHWTTREHRVLREHYERGGPDACAELLPGRSLGSIYQQARKLGLRAPRETRTRHRWPDSTPHTDALIRQCYQNITGNGQVHELAHRLGRPRWWVRKRALQLGLAVPRFKETPWTEAELELLERHAFKSPTVIARLFRAAGHRRTEAAIVVKRKRLQLGMKHDRDHYSAHQLAGLLGVDGKTTCQWIARGLLPARRRGTERSDVQGGDMWWIDRPALRAFIQSNPLLVDPRKADWLWLVELLLERDTRKAKED